MTLVAQQAPTADGGTNTGPLYLMHMVPDPRRLAVWAARHKLLDQAGGDLGYALHGLLQATFGHLSPRSFLYADARRGLLAYSSHEPDVLRQHASLAEPDVAAALGLDGTLENSGLAIRRFPDSWANGTVLGFEVRVRPVIREGRTGRERDAFLAAIDAAPGQSIDRGAVYVDWLRKQFSRDGAADLPDVQLTRFRRLSVTRRGARGDADGGRVGVKLEGPDAVLSGHLQVRDSEAFATLIRRGIGRHRAFGYGFLSLRPAAR